MYVHTFFNRNSERIALDAHTELFECNLGYYWKIQDRMHTYLSAEGQGVGEGGIKSESRYSVTV